MARLANIREQIDLVVSRQLSHEARQKKVAEFARSQLRDAQQKNKAALGHEPAYGQIVDGVRGARLEAVNPDRGVIVFEFELGLDVLRFVGEQLVLNSPVLTGRYRQSHVLLADGVEIDLDAGIPPADEYAFVNIVPYARKIERGESDQAPEGVYEVVADMAKRRFGNIADVKFSYRSFLMPYVALGGRSGGKTASAERRAAHKLETETRNPAIIVRIR